MTIIEVLLNGKFLALAGATCAVIFAGLGSARAVGMTGEAAAGLITEEPERFAQALLMQALPGTQGIYGLLTAFVVMFRIGIIGGTPIDLNTVQGILFFISCLPVAVVGYKSAISQGKTAISGIGIIAKKPQELAKAITFAALVETYAILALLGSILMIYGISL